MTVRAKIAGLFLYPIESTTGSAVDQASLDPRGLAADGRWVVTNDCGEFLTAREFPKRVGIRVAPHENRLQMSAPGMPDKE